MVACAIMSLQGEQTHKPPGQRHDTSEARGWPDPGMRSRMPVRKFQLLAFEDIMLLRGDLLGAGSLTWLLRDHAALLFPAWLFSGWKGESTRGREAWPAQTLMSLLLLRYSEAGLTRVGAVRRAGADAMWRSALRLPWDVKPPDEKTLREFEAFMAAPCPNVGIPRVLVLFEHITRLGLDRDIVDHAAAWVIDSTPMWCYGAVLCTVNLLGEGVRSLAKRFATARRVPLAQVAVEWDAPLVVAKSTKGHFDGTDWSDLSARSGVLKRLIELAMRGVERVMSGIERGEVRTNKHLPLRRLCWNLMRVVTEDLEVTAEGTVKVLHRTTSSRLISLTDPEAQHFRKSASKVCTGFKLHVLGDALSGLILALSVTPGGHHDSTEAHPLIARAKALRKDLREVLADAAYGGMPVRNEVQQATGVTLIAPPLSISKSGDGLGKQDFDVDFKTMTATCPGGVATDSWKMTKREDDRMGATFAWPKGSETRCTCAEKCPAHRRPPLKTGGTRSPLRRLLLHPDEQELRRLRAEWQTPAIRERYRVRTQGERLINEMTRRGARHASGWGLSHAVLQAHCIAAVNNLRLLAQTLAEASQRQRAA